MHILKKRADFLRVASSGMKIITHNCVLQLAPAATQNTQFGFTATKRIGNAVIRNRTKRRMRAAIIELLHDSELPHADYVLIGRHSTASCEYTELLRDLRYAFKKSAEKLLSENKAS